MPLSRLLKLGIAVTFSVALPTITYTACAANHATPTSAFSTSVPNMATSTNLAPQPVLIPTPPDINAKAYLLMDANSGKIIAQKNIHERVPPASLTKLMTLYLTFQALQRGSITLDTLVPISRKAWKTGGSKMFVKVGSKVPVKKLLQGIIVDSGNDACVALAEFLGGSEDSFVNMMNAQARLLNMAETSYADCTGMPLPSHYTSVYDLSLLSRAIIKDFPEYYTDFSQKWFTYNGIRQPNRNRLLWRFHGADGLKTGHTKAAGFCLISSAAQDGTRLIAIVMGAPTDEARAVDSIKLLTYGFRFFSTKSIYPAGTIIAHPRIWFGDKSTLKAAIRYNLAVTLPKGKQEDIILKTTTLPNLKAPIKKGQIVGQVNVTQGKDIIASQPLIALEPVEKGGFFDRIYDMVIRWFSNTSKPHVIQKKLSLDQLNAQPTITTNN